MLLNKTKCSLCHLDFDCQKHIYWYIVLKWICTEEYLWRLILFLNQCYINSILLLYWKKVFKNQQTWSFVSFVFIFLSRWVNSNKFELIHLNKYMNTKENCFKNFNEAKVILKLKNKRTSNLCKKSQSESSCV